MTEIIKPALRQFMRLFGFLALLIALFLCAEVEAAEIPYSGTWYGTIGSAKVQVYFSENGYGQYYYLKHKEGILLERNKDSNEWKESIRRMQASFDWQTTGAWKLDHVAADHMQGIWIDPDGQKQLPIDLKFVAALKKNNEGIEDMSAFYAPLMNSLQYSYKTDKFNGSEYKTIETETGTAFELSPADKKTAKLNEYIQSWLKEQAVEAYGCKMDGGENWHRTLTPQYILGNFLVIEDNLPDTFCGGAHGTWSHSHLVYDLNAGNFVDTGLWIKEFGKSSYDGSADEKTKFRGLIEKLNPRAEEDNNYFSLNAPYPTKEGLVFFTSHPYVNRACDEDIAVSYKDLAPYLTMAGKKALTTIPGLNFKYSLADAAEAGDIEEVRSLIRQGASVNEKDVYGATPLEVALTNGHMDIAKLLISKGADPNVKDREGNTLLNRTLKKESTDLAKFLIEQGANLNIQDKDGEPPLTRALSDDKLINIARLMIQKGADVNVKNSQGDSPLEMVLFKLENRDIDLAKLLMAKGADVNAKDSDGNPLLHKAIREGRTGIVKLLLENKADANMKDKEGEPPLYLVIEEKKTFEIAELLIKNGADVNARIANKTLLHLAIDRGSLPFAKLLIQSGANVNAKDESGSTPLHKVPWSYLKHSDIAQLLIEKGADVNAKNNDGSTPLHYAVSNGLFDMAALLVQNGAKINAKDSRNYSPLYLAAFYKHSDIVRLLIQKGADLNIIDGTFKETPLHKAIDNGTADIANLLIEKGADVNIQDVNGDSPLHRAASHGYTDIARHLIQKGADVKARNNAGDTPLLTAFREKKAEMVKLLLDSGSDVNMQGYNKLTPLHYAALSGIIDVARLLIEKGAAVNARASENGTPLHVAAYMGHTEMAKFLIEKGADVNAKTNDGATPLSLAIKNKHIECAAIIKAAGGVE